MSVQDQPSVRRVAILGNVNVGKSTLFDRLVGSGEHSVNIPGSTLIANRGVLSVGPGAAPRFFSRQCARCRPDRARRGGRHGLHDPCCGVDGEETACPGVGQKRRRWRGGRAVAGDLYTTLTGIPGPERPAVTHLYDTPGCGTLVAGSEDEMVARDLLLSSQVDSVLLVADAKNIRRSLSLALQVAELDLPMVFDLNMIDEAETMGVDVNDEVLEQMLGVPVTRTVAVEGMGVRSLAEVLLEPRRPRRRVHFPAIVEDVLGVLEELLEGAPVSARGLAILLLAGDRGAERRIAETLGDRVLQSALEVVAWAGRTSAMPLDQLIADSFHAAADRVVSRAVATHPSGPDLLVRLGGLAQRPFPGLIIAGLVVLVAYYWVGAFGATFVADNIATYLFDGLLIPLCERLIEPIPSAFVRDAIMDPDFGLLPTGLFLAVGIVLPVLFCFYLLQAVLEDSGYLPRLSVLFDRLFRWMGLNGQGLIPLVLGFSCVTMAVITTRMLPTRKERILLTLLLILAVPCAPLIAVMFVILGKLPWTASVVVFGVIGSQTLLAGYGAAKLIPGDLPDLILEIPRMRVPRPRVVLVKTWRRTWHFMAEALPIFLLASFVVFAIDRAGGLAIVERIAHPFVAGVLGLPDEAVQVFIKTAIRREAGATELNLLREQFDNVQLVVTMLVMTFLVPCINSVIVIFKERGVKTSLAILAAAVAWALVVGAVVNWVCRFAGVTFGG